MIKRPFIISISANGGGGKTTILHAKLSSLLNVIELLSSALET